MSQPDLAYSFTDVLSLQPSDALTDWKQMTWPRIHTVHSDHAIATIWMVSCHSINVSVNKYIGVWVFFSNVMVHLCAVATSICFLFKHKYARFYSILLALNGIFIPLTVGLITSREYSKNKCSSNLCSSNDELILVAISGVYHIVNWEMDPWMALLWGVGQVSIWYVHIISINSLGIVSFVFFRHWCYWQSQCVVCYVPYKNHYIPYIQIMEQSSLFP